MIRSGVCMPAVGELLRSILGTWWKENSGGAPTLSEMKDATLFASLQERLLDIVLTTQHALSVHPASTFNRSCSRRRRASCGMFLPGRC